MQFTYFSCADVNAGLVNLLINGLQLRFVVLHFLAYTTQKTNSHSLSAWQSEHRLSNKQSIITASSSNR